MRLLPRPKDHLSRRGRVVAWVGALLAILIIATLAVAVLMPVFAAAQLLSPSQASRRSGEPSALALIGVGVTLTGMDVGDTRTQLTLEVRNRADRAYLMIKVQCALHDESGTVIATKSELVWNLGAGRVSYERPIFWPPSKPSSAKCRAVEVE